jgi:hypothetical protein
MIIKTTPFVPFVSQSPVPVDELPERPKTLDLQPEPLEQPLTRSKRGIGSTFPGIGWFGRRPSRGLGAGAISHPAPNPVPAPRPKPVPPTKPVLTQPGPSPKPLGSRFKDAGQAVIKANKIKANDALVMTNLRKKAPISVAEAAKRLIDADSLVKSGVIATGPNASRVARDAFISAGITGLVSAPINVGAYAGSVAAGETIKSSYAPGVLPPPFLPSAASQPKVSEPGSTPAPADPFGARLEDVEMKLLGMGSTVMFLLGDTSRVFTKDGTWPTKTAERLSNMEKLLTTSEQHFKKAARQNGLVFKPYKPGQPIPTEAKERLELIEKKLERLVETYENLRFLAAMKNSENQSNTTAAT